MEEMINNETAEELENQEVLEESQENPVTDEEIFNKDTYRPRPKWQLVAAWIGIGIVVLGFALFCWHIASGGKI